MAIKRRQIFLPALVLTLCLMAFMQLLDRSLTTPAAPMGIVSYELAGSAAQSQKILDSWDQAAKIKAGFSLGLDYLFMLAYSLTIGLACIWAGGIVGRQGWPLARLGLPLGWGIGLAAVLDAFENLSLAVMLFSSPSGAWSQIAALCATVKFLLIGLALLWVAYGGLAWLIWRSKRRGSLPTRSGAG